MIVLLFQIKNVEKPVSDLNSNTDAPGLAMDAADSKLPAWGGRRLPVHHQRGKPHHFYRVSTKPQLSWKVKVVCKKINKCDIKILIDRSTEGGSLNILAE